MTFTDLDVIGDPSCEETSMADLTVKSSDEPDELRPSDITRVEIIDVDGVTAARLSAQTGMAIAGTAQ